MATPSSSRHWRRMSLRLHNSALPRCIGPRPCSGVFCLCGSKCSNFPVWMRQTSLTNQRDFYHDPSGTKLELWNWGQTPTFLNFCGLIFSGQPGPQLKMLPAPCQPGPQLECAPSRTFGRRPRLGCFACSQNMPPAVTRIRKKRRRALFSIV